MKYKTFFLRNTAIGFFFQGSRYCLGNLLALVCLTVCLALGYSVKVCCILSFSFLILAPLHIQCYQKTARWLNLVWVGFTPAVALVLTQMLLNVGIRSLDPQRIVLGMVCGGILLVFLLLCIMNLRAAVIGTIWILLALSAVNHFVFSFRGSEFAPYDFLAVGTAAAVAGQYTFSVSPSFVYACMLGILYCFAGFCIPSYPIKHTRKNTAICIVLETALLLGLHLGSAGLSALHFHQMGSLNNGYILNFSLQLKNMGVDKPAQYSAATVNSIAQQYPDTVQETLPSSKPDIIVIMSESYADLSVLEEELNTNIPVTPFFDSLRENTIRGYALVSGYGGGTSKTEYEFLTGNSLVWLPSGCFPFQQYVKDDSVSIISQLEQYGYSTLATHPAQGKNYMRNTVYPTLGFDRYYFIDDYPQENLLRGLVSDREMFEQIISWYEAKEKEDDLFLFGVTMQNHGDYDYIGDDFTPELHLNGYTQEYADVEQYLTILNHSDQALEYLISYFENVENDVIIAFFGDHFPKLDSGFIEELHGGAFGTLEEQMLQYAVPFFVWANYDIEEQDVALTSVNFLANYVYEAAGLPLPAYNRVLKDIQAVIPAMNAFGYYSKEQNAFIPYAESSRKEAKMLELYQILQYNGLFDKKNRSEIFFPRGTI